MTAALQALSTSTRRKDFTSLLPGQTPEGEHILSVLLKRTYDILPDQLCTRANADRPLFAGDVYWGDPMNSTVRYESDFVPFKLATDVVLNGKVYVPNGSFAQSCYASLNVAGAGKQILAIGDRFANFQDGGLPTFTDPLPFQTMDLRYERAYGGIDVYSDKRVSFPYPRNPLGRGFVVANSAKSLKKLPLPNLESPDTVLTPEKLCLEDYRQWGNQPLPAGFSWFPKTWLPRAQFAGVLPGDRALERQFRQTYAQLLSGAEKEAYLANPLPSMDFRFFNGASAGLTVPFLKGGERVITENLTPGGALSFDLPKDQPALAIDIGFGSTEPDVLMHTVMIRMEDRQVDLTWRAAILYDGPDWLPKMRKLEIDVT